MKTVEDLLAIAEGKRQQWINTANSQQQNAESRKRTEAESLILSTYYEGQVEAYTEVLKLSQ